MTKHIDDFMGAIRKYISYWEKQQDLTKKEALEGLAFSMLVMLDGMSGLFDGDVYSISESSSGIAIHEYFHKEGLGNE